MTVRLLLQTRTSGISDKMLTHIQLMFIYLESTLFMLRPLTLLIAEQENDAFDLNSAHVFPLRNITELLEKMEFL